MTDCPKYQRYLKELKQLRSDLQKKEIQEENILMDLVAYSRVFVPMLHWDGFRFEYNSGDWSYGPSIDIVAGYYNLFVCNV